MVTQEGELSQGQAVYCVVTVADPLQQSVRTQWVGDSVLMESTALYAHSSQDQAPTRVCAKLGMLETQQARIRVAHAEIARRRVYWWSYMTWRMDSGKTHTDPIRGVEADTTTSPDCPDRLAVSTADKASSTGSRKVKARAQMSVEDTETAALSSAWASRVPDQHTTLNVRGLASWACRVRGRKFGGHEGTVGAGKGGSGTVDVARTWQRYFEMSD